MRPAGFWIRWGAQFIDGVIFLIVYFGLSFALVNLSGLMAEKEAYEVDEILPEEADVPVVLALFVIVVTYLIIFLYETLLTASKKQGTLGKQALTIKVTTRDGERLTFGHAVGRYFAKPSLGVSQVIVCLGLVFGFSTGPTTSALLLIFVLGCILAAFMPRKQALQDLLARTYVVHGGRSGNRPARNRRGVKVKAEASGSPGPQEEH